MRNNDWTFLKMIVYLKVVRLSKKLINKTCSLKKNLFR